MKDKEFVYVQVGFTALLDNRGKYLPSVPMYRKVKKSELLQNGLTPEEDEALTDLAGFFIQKHAYELVKTQKD